MKVLVGALALVLATPVYALDFFSQGDDSKRSSKKTALEQRVQLLERRINTISNIVLRLDSLQQEMQQLRGDVEVQNHAMESMKQIYTDMDQRISRLSGEAPVGASMQSGAVSSTETATNDAVRPEVAPASGKPSWESTPITPGVVQPSSKLVPPPGVQAQARFSTLPPVVSSNSRPGAAPGQLNSSPVSVTAPKRRSPVASRQASKGEKSSYQKAFNLLMDREYDQAQNAFRSFLKKYPGSRLADNAQYWLAEANYVTRNFDTALVEFRKVVQRFPSSSKVSDTLLKIGYIQYEKKQWGAARKSFKGLVSRYPNSTASQLAKKRLDKMSGEGH